MIETLVESTNFCDDLNELTGIFQILFYFGYLKDILNKEEHDPNLTEIISETMLKDMMEN